MGSYYYLDDSKSQLGNTPVPEDEFVSAILSIAKIQGLDITDEMILRELQKEKPKTIRKKKLR